MNYLIGVALAIVVLWIIYLFNRFVSLRNRARAAWADIDVQLKRRHDLVPNLVTVVKGYAAHERGTLDAVTQARTAAMQASRPSERGEREESLVGQLSGLFALAEQYPQLKADKNFRALHDSLTEIENTISYARRYYNAVVRDFNTMLQVFPNNIVAVICGFTSFEFFQVDEPEERRAASVKFGN
jgi:LemA protein